MTQMDAIFAQPDNTATDPICKMTVDKSNPPGGTAEYQGTTFYFCAPGCRETFKKDPAKYA